jgi:hypothetical protein
MQQSAYFIRATALACVISMFIKKKFVDFGFFLARI